MTLMIDLPFQGLAAWVSYFREVELPVLRHTVHQLEALRADAENINTRQLATVIMNDPLMTLRVFCHMENHRSQRQVTDITTIERALMMIGLQPFFEQFKDLPIVEQQLKGHPKAMLGLLQVVARARHAADWGRDWALLRKSPEFDEIAVAALLHDFPEILMWCFAPTLAIRVKALQKENAARRSVELQQSEYGIPLYEIKQELGANWGLPQLLFALMNPQNADSPNVRNVKLAVDLARHTANGWRDAAISDDLKAIREMLHMSGSNLLERVGAPEEMISATRAIEDAAAEG
jgi:HD-like signal output (HDOD) protein